VKIEQSTKTGSVIFGIVVSGIAIIGIGMFAYQAWPPDVGDWVIICFFGFFSLAALISTTHNYLLHKTLHIEITDTNITIRDIKKSGFGTTIASFKVSEISELHYDSDCNSFLRLRDGKSAIISGLLMLHRDEIFRIISDKHPHIKLSQW